MFPFLFCCTLHITLYALRNILPGLFIVVYTLVVFMSCIRKCVMYVCQLSLLQLLIRACYRHFSLRLFVVVYKLVMLMLCCW